MQTYFGTSEAGHLQPAEFQCVSCGNAVSMDSCIVRPHGTQTEQAVMAEAPIPWLVAGGVFGRFWGTVKLGFSSGPRIPKMMGAGDVRFAASLYFAVLSWVSNTVNVAMALIFAVGSNIFFGTAVIPQSAWSSGVLQVSLYIMGPLWMLLSIAIAAWLASLPGKSDGLTFSRCYSIICFASGGLILNLIPVCGGFIGLILWAVQGCLAIAAACPKGRATGPVILALCGMVIGLVVQGVVSFGLGLLMQL
jgi:hypothetical protein